MYISITETAINVCLLVFRALRDYKSNHRVDEEEEEEEEEKEEEIDRFVFLMIQQIYNPRKVSAVRDFPDGCGTQPIKNPTGEIVAVTSEIRQRPVRSEHSCDGVTDQDYHHRRACSVDRFKEVESFDVIMKKAGFNLANNGNVGRRRFDAAKRKFTPSCGSKVKPLSLEESMRLIASQSRRRELSGSSTNIRRKLLLAKAVQSYRNSPEKKKEKKKLSSATATLNKVTMQQNQNTIVLSPREKVLRTLRLFKLVFKELERDKATRRGESKTVMGRIDHETRTILMREGIQVNGVKMIGAVPGIEVGDVFQYKSELYLIGLHFDIMGGIDYLSRGDLKLATSIVSSEGNGYMDRFDSDVMIYSGQGGNVTSKDRKLIEDQKLVTGNLALANSMREKTPVRVIRGTKRLDQRGKCYVYVGLYLVEDYWQERGFVGNVLFKFKLRRISG
ncbi:unnamed protein product [Thlaspi arvense]|uniref:YDG domain-containing protein n=1 Tax=Thlaspi arvense TaxID=13288 RepID=A0AAU9RM17_THLAR|nr:unnamed protein product [Thlaspi arvense]